MTRNIKRWFIVLTGAFIVVGLLTCLVMPRRHVYGTLISPDGREEAIFYLTGRGLFGSATSDRTMEGLDVRDRTSGKILWREFTLPPTGAGTNRFSDFWGWFKQQTNSVFLSNDSIASLTQTANDSSLPLEERAKTIFSLFAGQVRPNMTSTQVAAILSNPTWLVQSKTIRVDWRAKVPVKITPEDTIYWLYLFPSDQSEKTARWSICFRLSGGHCQPENVGKEFLEGKINSGNVQIMEYALCYVGNHNARREIVSTNGISIDAYWDWGFRRGLWNHSE